MSRREVFLDFEAEGEISDRGVFRATSYVRAPGERPEFTACKYAGGCPRFTENHSEHERAVCLQIGTK